MSLTIKAVEAAKAGNERRELADGNGLYLVIQPSGTKSWAFRYRHHGQTRKLTLGPYPQVPLADSKDDRGRVIVKGARTLAGEARQSAENGRDPQAEKRAAASDGPHRDMVPTAAALFIERYAKGNKSWQETARLLGLKPNADGKLETIPGGIIAKWASRKVQEVTKRDVLDALDKIVDGGAGYTANRTLAALRRFFSWLIERDILTASPCAGVKPPAKEESRDRVLTDDEIRWLWKSCDECAYPFGRIAQMLLLTGQRKSEVSDAIEAEFSKGDWEIPGARTKNGEPHLVPVSDQVKALIAALPKVKSERGYLFTTTGLGPVSGFSKGKTEIDAAMARIASEERGEKVEIAGWRFHDLRRTVASGLARLGIALPVIEKILNHTSGSFAGVVGVYQRHSYADEKRAALQAWANFVDELIKPRARNVVRMKRA